jgi:hypothetical protein
LQNNFCCLPIGQVSLLRVVHDESKTISYTSSLSIRIAAASNAGICWPAQEPKAHPGHAQESEAGRASHDLAASLDPRIDAGEPAPGRRSTLFFLPFFPSSLFIYDK